VARNEKKIKKEKFQNKMKIEKNKRARSHFEYKQQ
jgi:hypothetical protein